MKTFLIFLFTYVFSSLLTAQPLEKPIKTICNSVESTISFPNGNYLVGGRLPINSVKNQLSLEYYSNSDTLQWLRTYPLIGELKTKPQLFLFEEKVSCFFTIDYGSFIATIDRKSGNFTQIVQLENHLLGVPFQNGSMVFTELINQKGKYLAYNLENDAISYISIPQYAAKLQTLCLLKNNDIFYSYGNDFGIVSDRGEVKKSWNYPGLQILHSIEMHGDTSLLLAGSELSNLFNAENSQGYLALISTQNYDTVYWTKQVGSELTNDTILDIKPLAQSEIEFILVNEKELNWHIFSTTNKMTLETKKIVNEERDLEIISIHKEQSGWIMLEKRNKQLFKLYF
ncbi:hypothetical protein [Emticicia sp. W12TSBA100-4]|uniref:hypothetical protein n=1 Tax=Emticicia sp. W12TSBA100-4 TaxID=3160965 RepID=UPI003305FE52